ncbi:MAG TPA: SpoIIE family protein phosphatase [Acidimicrobiales bacterium]|nr:SpoIIE family protein phosphatase [Acidimicrobiales bacterium]
MTVRRRVQLLFLPFMLLLLADLALDRYLVARRDESGRLIAQRLDPARTAVTDLLQALVDQETGQRGFIITGDPAFLRPYDEGRARADGRIAELARLLAHDEPAAAAVERVASRVAAWRQLGAEFEIEAKLAGRDADAALLVATGTGTQLFDQARREVVALQAVVRGALASEARRLASLQDRIATIGVASLALAVVFAGAAWYLVVRWIADPVRALATAVRAVAAGDLDRPIPSPGPPDLAGLGRDIEAMRMSMLEAADDATRARRALARQGMIVLTLRDELAPGPVDLPPTVSVATRYHPAEGVVAGDWIDMVRQDGERVVLALVDVSGHGEDAAVFALKTKHLTMAAVHSGLGPAEVLEWLAYQLGDTGDRFLTAVIVEVDGASGQCRYASAGHPPMVICHTGVTTRLEPTGPILGPLPGRWGEARAALVPGSLLVAYSDGLVESRDGSTELGVDGLCELLASIAPGHADAVADACMEEAGRSHPAGWVDDLSLVVVEVGAHRPVLLPDPAAGRSAPARSSTAG